MRTGLLALIVSALCLAGCSPANGMEVRVFGSGAGESGEGGTGGDPGPEGYGGQPGPEGQGGGFAHGGNGEGGSGSDPGIGGSPGTGGDPGQGGSPNGGSGGGEPVGGSGGGGGEPSGGSGGGEPVGGSGGSGGGGTGGSGGGTGGSGGGTVCNYPTGGFGTSIGSVVSPNVSWDGYTPGAASSSSISIQSFFDCDGTKSINALLLVYGAGWCTACQEEAALLPDLMQTWGPAGIVVISLLVENGAGSPATAQTAKQWRDAFNLNTTYTAADPSFQLQSSTADSFPYKVLVDPRTMAIVSTYTGGTSDDAVMQLALKNK